MNVQVNGQSFNVPDGSNITVKNNVLYVNGVEFKGDGCESKHFKIEITGGLASVKVERGDVNVVGDVGTVDAGSSVTVTGNVGGKVDAGSSVTCGNVGGNVNAGSGVNCGDVTGDVDAGSSVKCGKVGGNIDAGSSVRHG